MHFGSIGLSGHPVPPPPAAAPQPVEPDARDPISDLLSQLSTIRRTSSNTSNAQGHGQMHQIQVQLQLERQHVINRQLELVPRTPQRPVSLREFSFPTVENIRSPATFSQQPSLTAKPPAKLPQNEVKQYKYLLDSVKADFVEIKEKEQDIHRDYIEEVFLATARQKRNVKKL